MKRLLTLSLASILATATMASMAFADEEANYPTRTLNARHALTTGSPSYADVELEEEEEEREEEVEAFNELDAQKAMEERQEVSGEEWQKTQDVQDQDLSIP